MLLVARPGRQQCRDVGRTNEETGGIGDKEIKTSLVDVTETGLYMVQMITAPLRTPFKNI